MNKNKVYTDIEIIEALRKRQSHIIKYIYDRYFNLIRLFILKNAGTLEDAHEIFQDSLLMILEKIDETDIKECDFGTLLLNRAKFQWLKYIEDAKTSRKKSTITIKKSDRTEDIELTDIIVELLNQLNPEDLMALISYYSKNSYESIANSIGWKDAETARRRIKASETKLLKAIKESDKYKTLIPFESSITISTKSE